MPQAEPPAARHVLLAGGGTGGHVFPALAVGAELVRRGWRVSFTGRAAGLEERLARESGVAFHPLPARPLLGKGLTAKLASLATVARSSLAAARLVRRLGVDAVLGTGGYVSAPAVIGARLAGKPVLLLEPNAHAGVANRWLSRFASGAAVAFAATAADLACPAEVTGVPVRAAFFAVPAELPPVSAAAPLRLLILGGSQGARQVNELLPAALALLAPRLAERGLRLSVLHQAGAGNVEATQAAYARAGLSAQGASVFIGSILPFLDDVAGAMAQAHLLVSRAGAITVAEICAAGRPALFLPLAIAQGHQVDNARLLADAGAADLLVGAAAQPETLAARLAELLGDPARLGAMGLAARRLARPGAVAAIAAIADRLTRLVSQREGGR